MKKIKRNSIEIFEATDSCYWEHVYEIGNTFIQAVYATKIQSHRIKNQFFLLLCGILYRFSYNSIQEKNTAFILSILLPKPNLLREPTLEPVIEPILAVREAEAVVATNGTWTP